MQLYICQITCHTGYKNQEAASDRQNSMSFLGPRPSLLHYNYKAAICSLNKKITLGLLVCVGHTQPQSAKDWGRASGSDIRRHAPRRRQYDYHGRVSEASRTMSSSGGRTPCHRRCSSLCHAKHSNGCEEAVFGFPCLATSG